MKIVPYEVVKGPNDDVRVKAGGKEYAPPEISAMILQKLKTDAEAVPRRDGHRRGDHRPRVLQQRPARGDQGRRQDRRPQRRAHHQRADRGRARLRPRQGGRRADDPRLRPRRRHVRRVRPRARRRRLRGQVDERRQPPRRRQLRQGGRRLDGRRVQARAGHRPGRRPDGAPAPVRGGREGEDRAVSSTMSTQINLPFITATPDGPKHLDLQLTRAKLEELTHDLLERTVGPTKQALVGRRARRVEDRPRRARRRHDPHAGRAGEGQGADRQGARTRASTRTRSSPSAPRSRAAC